MPLSLVERASRLVTWKPLSAGEAVPDLSLTADEGTWVRTKDYRDQLRFAMVFFRSLSDDATDAWLRDWQAHRARFEALDTAIFGVTTHRTDKLREYRNRLGLEFFLLYDPFSVEARKFRCTGRLRPICKENVVVVDKDGSVIVAARGRLAPAGALDQVAKRAGTAVPTDAAAAEGNGAGAPEAASAVRRPGQPVARVRDIDSAEAERLLKADGSSYKLVDVRTRSEYEADHSPVAVHIPVDEIPHRYLELGQAKEVICVCQGGARSSAAAEFLTSIGFVDVCNVVGGMTNWSGERVTGGQRA